MDELQKTKNELLEQQKGYRTIEINLITIFLSFILFISLTGQSIVIPVFPLYVKVFGGGAFQLGLLIGVFSLTGLIFSPIIGSLADKFGRKIFIVLGLLGFAIANLLYTQAQTFNQLIFFRIIEGSTAAGTGAIVNALLIDIIPANKRGRYLGFANGSGVLGIVIGPFFGGVLVEYGNIALPFIVSALVALGGMVVTIIVIPNDFSKFRHKHKSKKVRNEPFTERVNFTHWLIPGATIVFIILMIVRFINNISWSLIQPVVPIYLYALNYSPFDVGLFFSFFGLFMFLGQTFFGGLSDKYGRKKILQIGVGIYLLGFISIVNTTNIITFFISGTLDGIGLSLMVPAIVAFLADLTNSETHRGKVMGIYYDAFFLAGILGPIVGGYLGSVFNFNFVLDISITIIFIAMILSFFLKVPKNDSYSDPMEGEPSFKAISALNSND